MSSELQDMTISDKKDQSVMNAVIKRLNGFYGCDEKNVFKSQEIYEELTKEKKKLLDQENDIITEIVDEEPNGDVRLVLEAKAENAKEENEMKCESEELDDDDFIIKEEHALQDFIKKERVDEIGGEAYGSNQLESAKRSELRELIAEMDELRREVEEAREGMKAAKETAAAGKSENANGCNVASESDLKESNEEDEKEEEEEIEAEISAKLEGIEAYLKGWKENAGDFEGCVEKYAELRAAFEEFENEGTGNSATRRHLKSRLTHWSEFFTGILLKQYETSLKNIKWPFTRHSGLPSPPPTEKSEFQRVTRLLMSFSLPDKLSIRCVTSSISSDFPPCSPPTIALLSALRKRFSYHFCGNRPTNRPDKPEWMFAQALTWLRDHRPFLEEWAQPAYDTFGKSAQGEFATGLVKTVCEKLAEDLPELQYDDALFTHTLDESLGFDRELRECHGYPSGCASVLNVLTQAAVFVKWMKMERKGAERRMDDMLNDPTAWRIISEDERCKVTKCGDVFVTMLSAITDRYGALPQPGHRLQFLELQLDLIDEFRLRLVQLCNESDASGAADHITTNIPAILNTAHYLMEILNGWGSNTHFLMLSHFDHKMKLHKAKEGETSTVFNEATTLLQRFIDERISDLCEGVAYNVKAKSRSYRTDKWYGIDLPPDGNISLSLSGSQMFQTLADQLCKMQSLISPELFKTCWRSLAAQLCQMFLEEIVLKNTFSEGGARQLQFDVQRNILPLFAQFTRNPEAYFLPLLEACKLLCSDLNVDYYNVPFGVTRLTPTQMKNVLDRRYRGIRDKSSFD